MAGSGGRGWRGEEGWREGQSNPQNPNPKPHTPNQKPQALSPPQAGALGGSKGRGRHCGEGRVATLDKARLVVGIEGERVLGFRV